jgi:hypothetical protein
VSVMFLIWLAGLLLLQPITKRVLKEHDRYYARYRDDEPDYLLLITEHD